MQTLQAVLVKREQQYGTCPAGRLFYLALPPSVYPQVRLWFMFALKAWYAQPAELSLPAAQGRSQPHLHAPALP